MLNFCTLFNQSYFSRGLALYQSLKEHSSNFHLYIFAFDEKTKVILSEIALPEVTVIGLEELENEDLLRVKPTRTSGEYCWTCTPAIIKYSLEHFQLDHCTYLDADLFFFKDPKVLIDEVLNANKDVLITPHNYTWIFDQTKASGIYCVQFMYFKNTRDGMTVLKDWYDQCIDWCYARAENGRFGDQKYLDVWPQKYNCVHILEHLGALAPWNVNSISLDHLVFYHFHGFKITNKNKYFYGWYPLPKKVKKLLYEKYSNEISEVEAKLSQHDNYLPSFNPIIFNLSTVKSWIKYRITQIILLIRK